MSSPALAIPAASMAAGRLERLIPFGIAALVIAVAVSTVTPWPVGAFEDDAIYTVLAKSLAEGEGYRLVNLPGAPNATHFPPGYPAFLALLWRIWPQFPENLVLFKFANAMLLGVGAAGAYMFGLRVGLGRTAAALVALGSGLSVVVLLLSGMLLSEPLFLALLPACLLATERAVQRGERRDAAIAGVLLGVLALVRTLGLFAIPVALGLLLVRRRFAAAAILAGGAALLVLPWQVWVALHQHDVPSIIAGKYGSYTGWVARGYAEGGAAFVLQVVQRNVRDMINVLGYLVAPVSQAGIRLAAVASLVALLAIGSQGLARRAPVTVGFMLLYVAVVLAWPFEPNRFLLGIWPLLGVTAAFGVSRVWRWRSGSRAQQGMRYGMLAAACALAAGYALYNSRGYQHSWWVPVQRAGGERLKPIAEWVAAHTAMDAVIATDHDPAVFLYTGRRAVPTSTWLVRERVQPLTQDEDIRAVAALLRQLRPDFYLPTSRMGVQTATALSQQTPALLHPLAVTPNGVAYRVLLP